MTHRAPDDDGDETGSDLTDSPNRGVRNWILGMVVLGALLIVSVSVVSALLIHNGGETPPAVQPSDTGTNIEANVTSQPPETFQVDGDGSVVVDLGRTINGRWKLEYTADRYHYIVLKGVRADGTIDGPTWIAAIGEVDVPGVHGSTIISTNNVTMVMAQDINGPWHLTFTKLS